jgi:hypothetical protein
MPVVVHINDRTEALAFGYTIDCGKKRGMHLLQRQHTDTRIACIRY